MLSSLMPWSQPAERPKTWTAACVQELPPVLRGRYSRGTRCYVSPCLVAWQTSVRIFPRAATQAPGPKDTSPHSGLPTPSSHMLLHAGGNAVLVVGARRLVIVEVYPRWLLATVEVTPTSPCLFPSHGSVPVNQRLEGRCVAFVGPR